MIDLEMTALRLRRAGVAHDASFGPSGDVAKITAPVGQNGVIAATVTRSGLEAAGMSALGVRDALAELTAFAAYIVERP